ncbi:hypothetical protein SVEN_1857 [Streptomyces venezuelae ATCC 10712]|uniref:Uncharacterized protein n=1 Tax=Streptomyces venezuelae (strain ATCC 10712 / CBS 650.69 / DSM 40230 / JCM 4526 / NBRC 13096 / PD 04745) TaxID=953739 RepID=F2RJD4_STRVP|nr:hypothetical protein SVEN_1857 [Streptomyces venezuelae ATCC 10712]
MRHSRPCHCTAAQGTPLRQVDGGAYVSGAVNPHTIG